LALDCTTEVEPFPKLALGGTSEGRALPEVGSGLHERRALPETIYDMAASMKRLLTVGAEAISGEVRHGIEGKQP